MPIDVFGQLIGYLTTNFDTFAILNPLFFIMKHYFLNIR